MGSRQKLSEPLALIIKESIAQSNNDSAKVIAEKVGNVIHASFGKEEVPQQLNKADVLVSAIAYLQSINPDKAREYIQSSEILLDYWQATGEQQ